MMEAQLASIEFFKQMTVLTRQVGVVIKQFWLNRIKCDRWCVFVFVFVFRTTKHGNIVLQQVLREIFGLKNEVVAGG